MATSKPDFLKVGTIVKVQHWYGQVVDVAESDSRIMVLVTSPKSLWRHHPPEWLEYDDQQIRPASPDEALASFDIYIERVKKTLAEIEAMKNNWLASTHLTAGHIGGINREKDWPTGVQSVEFHSLYKRYGGSHVGQSEDAFYRAEASSPS